jgi:hypothetical protein
MEFTYHIDKTNRIVTLEGDDPSLEIWQQTLLAVFSDPDFETGFNFLSDRQSASEARSTYFLRAALDFLKAHAREMGICKWATVVSTIAAYGMGRMTQILSEDSNIEIGIFKDIDEARNWLLQDAGRPQVAPEARKTG